MLSSVDKSNKRVCAKLADYDQLSLIVPPAPLSRLIDQSGTAVPNFFILNKDGTRDMGFLANPGQRYFIEWTMSEAPPAAPAAKKKGPADLQKSIDDLPSNWPADVPIVEVTPLMRLRPTWAVDHNSLKETTGGFNSFLMSKGAWGDFDLTVKLRPEPHDYAGIILRCNENQFTGSNALFWIIGSHAKGQSGAGNNVYGLVRDDSPAPGLNGGEWNELHVVAVGSKVTLFLNGELCKTIFLPEGKGLSGHVGLAGIRNRVEFSDLHIKALPDGRTLLKENFPGNALHTVNWQDIDGKPVRGFVRIVNTGSTPASFQLRLQFHREPFAINSVPLGTQPLAPQAKTAWLWPEGMLKKYRTSAPFSLFASPVGTGTGRLEFASGLNDKQIVRSLDFKDIFDGTAELLWADFSDASQIVTPQEDGQKRVEWIRAMKFAGSPPVRFPIGYAKGTAADLEAGRLLGFTAMNGTPTNFNLEAFRKFGYRYIYTYTHILTDQGKGSGYNTEVNQREMKAFFDAWKKLGVDQNVYRISLYDEAMSSTADFWKAKTSPYDVSKNPSGWQQIMDVAELKPADFLPPGAANPWEQDAKTTDPKAWAMLKIASPSELESNRQGVDRALRLNSAIWPARLGGVSRAAQEAFGRPVGTTVNIHVKQLLFLNFGFIDPWRWYGPQGVLNAPQVCDYFVGYPLNEEFLIDLQRGALCGADKSVDGYFAAQSTYLATTAKMLELRAFSALAAGARSLSYYEWGPRNIATENWYADDPDRLATIGRINHAVGWVEDMLLEGHPPQAPVAIFVSPTSDRWESSAPVFSNHQIERRQLHSLLRCLNYQSDFIGESFLPADNILDAYRVIFLTDACLESQAAQKLAAWVERGGTLIAITSAGECDELARPGGKLAKTLGIQAIDHKAGAAQKVTMSAGPTISIGAGAIASASLDGALVLAKFEDGSPALWSKNIGKGRLLFFAFMPGNAFHLGSTFTRDGLTGTQNTVLDAMRPLLTAAGAPMCETNHPLVSARVIESASGSVVFLINRSNAKLDHVKVTLRKTGVNSAVSLQHGDAHATKNADGSSTWDLPLDLWDVVKVR